MSKRFIDMGPDRRLVALDTASCDVAFSLIRRIAVERSDPAWSGACDEVLANFLRDWDQGAIAIRLREHLGSAQLGSLVDAALEVSRGGGCWTREEHQRWVADLGQHEAVSGIDLAVASDALVALRGWLDGDGASSET